MDLLNSRINRRTLGGLAAGTAATAGFARLALAQDATPEAEVDVDAIPTAQATLPELENVPQVNVVANNRSYAVYVGGENQPGWYVFNLENASESDASLNLARLPEDASISEFNSAMWQISNGNVDELPEWFGDVTYAGGTFAAVGETNSALVNLDAGEWVLFSSLAASAQNATTIQVLSADETTALGGEPVATPVGGVMAPEGFGSTFTVSVGDGSINADSSPGVGYNVIGVRNDATSAANFVVLHSTESVDDAAAADLATAFLAGEATDANLAGGMGALSSDAYGYIELEAEAGTYIGFSSMLDADGASQIDGGAIVVFNVG